MMKVDKYRPRSETPPLDFDSEDNSEDHCDDDAIDVPFFRVVVIRNNISVSDSESVSEDITDSDVEPQ